MSQRDDAPCEGRQMADWRACGKQLREIAACVPLTKPVGGGVVCVLRPAMSGRFFLPSTSRRHRRTRWMPRRANAQVGSCYTPDLGSRNTAGEGLPLIRGPRFLRDGPGNQSTGERRARHWTEIRLSCSHLAETSHSEP